ncbi:MAG: dihydroneopterin aldolase [Candidatus Tyrphobacter sp.]
MDRITLRGIGVYARHGADPKEREREQRFELDVAVAVDLHAACESDDLAQTLHYGTLYRQIVQAVRENSHALLERVASDVLETIFSDGRVASATVSISKPGLLDGATPSVTLERVNPRYGERS